jgi:hypothetical protein
MVFRGHDCEAEGISTFEKKECLRRNGCMYPTSRYLRLSYLKKKLCLLEYSGCTFLEKLVSAEAEMDAKLISRHVYKALFPFLAISGAFSF